MNSKVCIGTRGSKLALWQAHDLQEQLSELQVDSELKIIKTRGDKIQNLSFDKIEGKGFFTKEIEDALIQKEVDIAVHSLKDLQTTQPKDLIIGGLSMRENPRDLLIIKQSSTDSSKPLSLKENAIVGTSSMRRKSQIKNLIPSCMIKDLRGNVPTRINKLRDQDYDAVILASAGVNRLQINLEEFKVVELNPKEFVPAPAQGVIGYQCRKEDIDVRKILSRIHNDNSASCTNIERKVLQLFDGGCHLALGVHVERDTMGNYHAVGAYAPDQDAPLKRVMLSQSTSHALAEKIYKQLKD